jgi:hypothetical protein
MRYHLIIWSPMLLRREKLKWTSLFYVILKVILGVSGIATIVYLVHRVGLILFR